MTASDPAPLVTDDDVWQARLAASGVPSRDVGDYVRAVLESALRPDGLVDRAMAEFFASVTGYEVGGRLYAPEDVTLIRVQLIHTEPA